MKRVLIVGCTGQDGSYLHEMAERRGDTVLGLARRMTRRTGEQPGPAIDIVDGTAVRDALAGFAADEIYYLAAYHHSSEQAQPETGELISRSFSTHVDGLVSFLEAMRTTAPQARLFYAASSHIFGNPPHSPQTEATPFAPISPYGISKAAGVEICRHYRRHHGLFCSTGILYNHESPRRPAHFLSQRIVRTALAIRRGTASRLTIGNLDATVDWGYAPDYVDAMMRTLQTATPDDFVVASGRSSRVRDFVACVFAQLSLDLSGQVVEDPSLVKKPEQGQILLGDPAKLMAVTGWRPRHDLKDMARLMTEAARDLDA